MRAPKAILFDSGAALGADGDPFIAGVNRLLEMYA
jgi:hypothetical protein